jgi:hypothetical protein
VREKISLTMNRSLAFVGAFALAAAQPAVTLGAPPGGLAISRPAAPAPHAAARGGSANQDDFKVPFHVDLQPQPLMEPQPFTLRSAGFNPQAPVSSHRRYVWQSTPGYLWYPALSGPACYPSNSFLDSPSEQQPADLTIGSLVDGKSNLLSPPSHNAGLAAGNDPGAASSSPFTLQVGFYPTACGPPSFTNL